MKLFLDTDICIYTIIGLSELSIIMSNYTIALSEETYHSLLEVVEKQGLTPEAWIVAQLPKPQPEEQPLWEKIDDLIGSIESSAEPHHQFTSTDFGEQIAKKLSKQGLHRP